MIHVGLHEKHCAESQVNLLFSETDRCQSNPCLNGATCTNQADSYVCKCDQKYYGIHCEIGININVKIRRFVFA